MKFNHDPRPYPGSLTLPNTRNPCKSKVFVRSGLTRLSKLTRKRKVSAINASRRDFTNLG